MPGGDRSGPEGKGSRTGRGLGYCTGNDMPGAARGAGMGRGFGRGLGRGFGMGRGFGRWNRVGVSTANPVQETGQQNEIEMFENDKKELEKTLEDINKRLEQLKKQD